MLLTQVWPEEAYSPDQAQREVYELIVKAGRRCAHDLNHAADDCQDRERGQFWHERANMWLDVFYMEDGKNYRHKLHRAISDREMVIENYRKLVEKHNLTDEAYEFDEQLPF